MQILGFYPRQLDQSAQADAGPSAECIQCITKTFKPQRGAKVRCSSKCTLDERSFEDLWPSIEAMSRSAEGKSVGLSLASPSGLLFAQFEPVVTCMWFGTELITILAVEIMWTMGCNHTRVERQ